jgi:aconitate hydratase
MRWPARVRIDLSTEPLGEAATANLVYLRDIWPSTKEIADAVERVSTEMFHKEYAEVFKPVMSSGKPSKSPQDGDLRLAGDSTYIQHPPFFDDMTGPPPVIDDVQTAPDLGLLGDSVTTDHISPAGNIKADSPAGRYLREKGVEPGTSTPTARVAATTK